MCIWSWLPYCLHPCFTRFQNISIYILSFHTFYFLQHLCVYSRMWGILNEVFSVNIQTTQHPTATVIVEMCLYCSRACTHKVDSACWNMWFSQIASVSLTPCRLINDWVITAISMSMLLSFLHDIGTRYLLDCAMAKLRLIFAS